MAMSEVATTAAQSTTVFRDREVSDLATDARFVDRLYKKIRTGFTERGANGIVVLREDFVRMDRRINADTYAADKWAMKSMLSTALKGITDVELEVLFLLQDTDEDGLVDMAEVAMSLRKQFQCTSQQFHDIIRRVRAKKFPRDRCSFLKKRRKPGASTGPFTRMDVFRFLTEEMELTQSEAFLFLDYCSPEHNNDPAGSPGGELDCDFCDDVLFAHPLPDNIAFPLLASKLAEAASDPQKQNSGTVGILRVCRACASPPLPLKQSDVDEYDDDEEQKLPPIEDWVMDKVSFRKFSSEFGTGLPASETDLLFSYICNREMQLVTVRSVINLFAQRLAPIPPEDYHVIVAAIRALVLESSSFGLVKLHMELCAFGGDRIPIDAFVAAHRKCSVKTSLVSDVRLELVHRDRDTCLEYIALLRGEVPEGREKLIEQLFHKLDENNQGRVERAFAYEAFRPDKLEKNLIPFDGLSDAFGQFLDSLPSLDSNVTMAEFVYFWGAVSCSIDDDSRFSMTLWKGFGMHAKRIGPQSPERRFPDQDTVSHRSPAASHRTPRRRMLE